MICCFKIVNYKNLKINKYYFNHLKKVKFSLNQLTEDKKILKNIVTKIINLPHTQIEYFIEISIIIIIYNN